MLKQKKMITFIGAALLIVAITGYVKIFNEYTSIFNRYREENKEDVKQRKIIKMKEELAKLEGNS